MSGPSEEFEDQGVETGIFDADVQHAPVDAFGQTQFYEDPLHQLYQQQQQHQQNNSEYYEPTINNQQQIPDVLLLSHLCATAQPPKDFSSQAKKEADLSWEPVREWLRAHTAEEVQTAAQQRGDSAMTALHIACRNVPPSDIVDCLLTIASDTAQWQDSFQWLPIHYACACGADADVIRSLTEVFPESKTIVDDRGRTPLHFCLGNSNPDNPVSPDVVVLLSSTGAATYPDYSNGMLPLHYACAYGASEEVLYVLTDAYEEGITTVDRNGRIPLHYAFSNAGKKAAPGAIRLLLGLKPETVNARGGGLLPLKVLADFANTVKDGENKEHEYISKSLENLMSFKPNPTANFFNALQSLPEWLKERAVVMPYVQTLLNNKISQRWPTGVLLSDFFIQVLVLVFYALSVEEAIDRRFSTNAGDGINYRKPVQSELLIPLFIGGAYFLSRALTQIFSLLALGAIRVWFENPSNFLDVTYIFLVFYWAVRMGNDPGMPNTDDEGTITAWDDDDEAFRTGVAVSVIFIWMKFLAYLRNTYIDFAVFLGGLFYVVRRLVAFLVCLCIILIAFSQMFFTVYRRDPDRCPVSETPQASIEDLQCESFDNIEVYCNRWTAFLNTFTMLLGEVDETTFDDRPFPLALFILFMFLVVILLANVLIAIVTDSYKVIQDQRAAIVFWSNRLIFVAELDAVANGPWKRRARELLGLPKLDDSSGNAEVTFGKDLWNRLMSLYREEIDGSAFSFEFVCVSFLRFFAAIIVIPLWLILGFITLGILWPPQVREYIVTSKVIEHAGKDFENDELRKRQTRILQEEVKLLKDELLQELAIDRTQVIQMKSLVSERKQEIQTEMKHIKRIVAMLFEQQSGT